MTKNALRFSKSQDSNDLFEALFHIAPIMLHSVGKDGHYIRVSAYLAAKLGYKVEDMVGQPILNFMTDESRTFAEQVSIPEFRRQGRADTIEYDFLCNDGAILPLVTSAIAEYDTDGQFSRSLAVSFDNSAAKKINQELQRKSKGEAMGELVGGVAHDFNNLLAIVQGNLGFLRQNPDDPGRSDLIEDAFVATTRGAVIIDQLQTFGRRRSLSTGNVNANDVAETAIRLVKRLFPANIETHILPDDDLWMVRADAALLETALLNILNNARDAMPAGGQIRIETKNVDLSNDTSGEPHGLAPGRYVRIAISDTGSGIDERNLRHVFEPFYTTKAVGDGSGLGLAMVRGFVEQSRGSIRVTSKLGMGTTVWIYLPVDSGGGAIDVHSDLGPFHLSNEKTVLIVEDDTSLRTILARQLEDDRIRIFEAETGDHALNAIHAGLEPDLVITDVMMPGSLQGPDLVQRARAILPDLQALFISGCPPDIGCPSGSLGSTGQHLTKPVSQNQLRATVMDLLIAD